MASPIFENTPYKGLDRRSNMDRRGQIERRNLVRFETSGSDRRMGGSRRNEELVVKLYP